MCAREEKGPVPREASTWHFTQYSPLAKNNSFSHHRQEMHDETPRSPAYVSCRFFFFFKVTQPMNLQPRGRLKGMNLWTGPVLTALTEKGVFQNILGNFFFASSASSCLQDSFLFPFLKLTLLNKPDLARCLSTAPGVRAFLFETVSNRSFLFQMLNQ